MYSCCIQWNSYIWFLDLIKVFSHSVFNFSDLRSIISMYKFPPFKIFLNFMLKSTDHQRNLKWGFHYNTYDSLSLWHLWDPENHQVSALWTSNNHFPETVFCTEGAYHISSHNLYTLVFSHEIKKEKIRMYFLHSIHMSTGDKILSD